MESKRLIPQAFQHLAQMLLSAGHFWMQSCKEKRFQSIYTTAIQRQISSVPTDWWSGLIFQDSCCKASSLGLPIAKSKMPEMDHNTIYYIGYLALAPLGTFYPTEQRWRQYLYKFFHFHSQENWTTLSLEPKHLGSMPVQWPSASKTHSPISTLKIPSLLSVQ